MILKCKKCSKEFKAKPNFKNINKRQKFCSKECYGLSERGKLFEKRIKIMCKQCGKEFFVIKARENKAKFCSRECHKQFKIGKRYSQSTEFKKGNKTWCTGLTKETDERIKTRTEKGSKTKKEKFSKGELKIWCDSLTKETDERVKKISESKMGEKNPMFGKRYHHSEETKNKMKEKRARQIFPVKDTKIEVKIQNFLKKLNVKFITHKHIKIEHSYQCDILIPAQKGINKKTIIELDGCYWHGCTSCKDKISELQQKWVSRDKIRTKELKEGGYNVIRLWEHEIRPMKIEDFKKLLNKI